MVRGHFHNRGRHAREFFKRRSFRSRRKQSGSAADKDSINEVQLRNLRGQMLWMSCVEERMQRATNIRRPCSKPWR